MELLKTSFLLFSLITSVYMGVSGMREAAAIGTIPFNPEHGVTITSLDYVSTDGNCIQYTANYSDDQNEVIEICK